MSVPAEEAADVIEVRVEPIERSLLDGVDDPLEEGTRRRVDVGLVPWFVDERPLRGLAGYIDWRSCGMLTRMVRGGWCTGALGEAVLLPGRRGLPMDRLVLLGWGSTHDFDETRARRAAQDAVRVISGLRPVDVLFAMPGAVQERQLVEAVFMGLAEALATSDAPRRGPPERTGAPEGAAEDRVDQPATDESSPSSIVAIPASRWWVVSDGRHVARLRRLLEGPPRAADG